MIDWPLDSNRIRRGDDNNTFGMVRRRADGSPKPHQGWDFFAPVGTPVYAVGDGKVSTVSAGGDYGLTIVHSVQVDGAVHYAAYAHMADSKVRPGDSVKRGQVIGRSGDSGNARGMKGEDLHLHFELRTAPLPGKGLAGRVSPIKAFGTCPLGEAVKRRGAA